MSLSDSLAVVLPAYLAVFLPWTLSQASDFLTAHWHPLSQTRRSAYTHLLILSLPSLYIVFYIIIQAAAADYKETFAAVVGLVYTLLHVARAAWALWQMRLFERWVEESRAACREVGLRVEGGEVWINDSVVDNQLLHGEAACFLRCGRVEVRLKGRGWREWARFVAAVLVTPAYFLLSVAGVKGCEVTMVPVQPVDMWLNWAVVFAAQALRGCMHELDVAAQPDMGAEDGLEGVYQRRRDYFAREVLASAALQLGDVKPFMWEWEAESDMSDGRVTKQELLRLCMQTGRGLPLGAPQTELLGGVVGESRWERGEECRVGYGSYEVKLRRKTEELPAGFGDEVLRFDVGMLEWLAVVLFVGARSEEYERVNGSGLEGGSEGSGVGGFEDGDSEGGGLEEDDLAIETLAGQLGFADYHARDGGGPDRIVELCAFPMARKWLTGLSDRNRLVLRVGEVIDVWLALVAGEQVLWLMQVDEGWKGKVEGCGEDGELLFERQTALELARLEYQFTKPFQRYCHLEQTLTFIGYDMEHVRSELACWGLEPGHSFAGEGVWNPVIAYTDESGATMTRPVELEPFSVEVRNAIERGRGCSVLQSRAFHVRLIWELRKLLQGKQKPGKLGPGSDRIMMLALLAFPSLRVSVEKEHEYISRCHQLKEYCELSVSSSSTASQTETADSNAVVAFEFAPVFGPQELSIILQCIPIPEGRSKVLVCLKRSGRTGARNFQWHLWRDAFDARLFALGIWQTQHSMPNVRAIRTNKPLSSNFFDVKVPLRGTGNTLLTWGGWQPFRFGFCRFELATPGVIVQYRPKKDIVFDFKCGLNSERAEANIPREEPVAVDYSTAARENLQHACFVVAESLDNANSLESAGDQGESAANEGEMLVKKAELLSRTKADRDFGRALLLLEIAAVDLHNLEALTTLVDLMTSTHTGRGGTARVVRVIERFIGRQLGYVPGAASVPVVVSDKLKEIADHVLDVYNLAISRDGMDPRLVRSFSRWVRMNESIHGEFDAAQVSILARRSFLASRCSSALCTLGMVSSPSLGPLQAVLAETKEVSPLLNVMFSEDKSDRNKRQAILRKALNMRAIAETGNVDAMYSLAILHQDEAVGLTPDFAAAAELYNLAALKGDTNSMNNLGKMLYEGYGNVKRDRQAALQLFKKASDRGSVVAMSNLGTLVNDGSPEVPNDAKQAMVLYEKAIAEGNHVPAMVNLANILRDGTTNVPADIKKACALYERAISEGQSPFAMNNLAVILQNGHGDIRKDPKRALQLLEKAAEFGPGTYIKPAYNLANLLRDGAEGVPRDEKRAVLLFERVINEGKDTDAMNNLGQMYQEGCGEVRKDLSKAVDYFQRAIASGDNANPMNNLGNVFRNGDPDNGVTPDFDTAAEWYEKAIERGNVEAMFNFGTMLSFESYTGKDLKRAAALFERAAGEGKHAGAMRSLAIILLEGCDGISRDPDRGVELLERAIQQGNVESMKQLAIRSRDGSQGVKKDARRAVDLLEKAISVKEDVDALNDLACILRLGTADVLPDPQRAASLFQRAVDKSSSSTAIINLAHMYLSGAHGFRADTVKAAQMYERAVLEHNDTMAAEMLAAILSEGAGGVEKDAKRSAELLEMAIAQGRRPLSMLHLANMLLFGREGIERDPMRAIELYERASGECKLTAAMFSLGSTFEFGFHGEKDVRRAIGWYEQAVAQENHVPSLRALHRLLLTTSEQTEADATKLAQVRSQLRDLGEDV